MRRGHSIPNNQLLSYPSWTRKGTKMIAWVNPENEKPNKGRSVTQLTWPILELNLTHVLQPLGFKKGLEGYTEPSIPIGKVWLKHSLANLFSCFWHLIHSAGPLSLIKKPDGQASPIDQCRPYFTHCDSMLANKWGYVKNEEDQEHFENLQKTWDTTHLWLTMTQYDSTNEQTIISKYQPDRVYHGMWRPSLDKSYEQCNEAIKAFNLWSIIATALVITRIFPFSSW